MSSKFFLLSKADGEVSISADDSGSVKGSLIYPSSDNTSPDRTCCPKDENGTDVTAVKCIRKNGLVELVMSSSISFNEYYYNRGKVLGTLPEDMRPYADVKEAVNYGADNGYKGHFSFSDYKFSGNSQYNGEGTWTDGQIKSGSKRQGKFVFTLARPVAYDLEITLMHSNGNTIMETDKNGDKFERYISAHPFVLKADTQKATFLCMTNYKTTGTRYLSAEVKGVGTNFEQLLSLQIEVV